ncbi:hypothetical protein V9T40_004531 [Parthenolecanium corni]|uniref:Uncharacterized protein n=1 Tax=Parthenolecanium corni TaxID=536013 RepID=A0AAN9TU82_9HEMI
MLNNMASKFKFKRPTFGVKNPANQSNLDGFIKKGNETTSRNEETPSSVSCDKLEESRAPVIVDQIARRVVEKSSNTSFTEKGAVSTLSTSATIKVSKGSYRIIERLYVKYVTAAFYKRL